MLLRNRRFPCTMHDGGSAGPDPYAGLQVAIIMSRCHHHVICQSESRLRCLGDSESVGLGLRRHPARPRGRPGDSDHWHTRHGLMIMSHRTRTNYHRGTPSEPARLRSPQAHCRQPRIWFQIAIITSLAHCGHGAGPASVSSMGPLQVRFNATK
jgi:hypothetical protein